MSNTFTTENITPAEILLANHLFSHFTVSSPFVVVSVVLIMPSTEPLFLPRVNPSIPTKSSLRNPTVLNSSKRIAWDEKTISEHDKDRLKQYLAVENLDSGVLE